MNDVTVVHILEEGSGRFVQCSGDATQRRELAFGCRFIESTVIAERVNARMARLLFAPLLVAGAGSVMYWYATQLAGHGDLRVYALVQFGSLTVVVLVLALYRSQDRGSAWLWISLALYGVAKAFEMSDGPIYHALGVVSGHTLKHVTAAAAVGCVVAMLRVRSESLSDDLDLVFSELSSFPEY